MSVTFNVIAFAPGPQFDAAELNVKVSFATLVCDQIPASWMLSSQSVPLATSDPGFIDSVKVITTLVLEFIPSPLEGEMLAIPGMPESTV
jgi:hypothetical protein